MRPRICTAALAYPRGELPFVAEWLDYHLTLGVDHVFLGLHVNEDLLGPENYVTVMRPFSAMYELDGTEADIVERFLDVVRPFTPRVTTYLFHRSFASEPEGHREAQRHLYNSVLATQRGAYDWICPHDIDEYIVPQPPFETIPDALAECPNRYAAVVMEQVIVRERWDQERRPRPAPLLVPDLLRCAEIVPEYHGMKTFTRPQAAASLGIHVPQLLAESVFLMDRRLLHYHFHGFPRDTEAPARPISIEHEVFDVTDDRPWRLRRQALASPPVAVGGSGG